MMPLQQEIRQKLSRQMRELKTQRGEQQRPSKNSWNRNSVMMHCNSKSDYKLSEQMTDIEEQKRRVRAVQELRLSMQQSEAQLRCEVTQHTPKNLDYVKYHGE